MEPCPKRILKKNAFHVEVLSIFPINSRFQSLPRDGEEPPLLLEITPSRAPWLHILLTEDSFRVFLSEHKLALWECGGARWLKAMLIRGNKMAFLLHLWPLSLTTSPKS